MRNIPNSSCIPQEKVQCVTWYNETCSITTVRRKFRTRYQRTTPSPNTILNWGRNFELPGNVENRNASGRPSITPQAIQTVSRYLGAHPRRSLRRAQTDLQISHTTTHKILKVIIHMFPYKIRRVQQSKPDELLQRKQLAARCLLNLRPDPNFLWRIVYSEECVFHVTGIAIDKNARFRGTENTRLVQEHQLNSAKIIVWCGIHANGVLDPYYFNNETVRGADYYELLNACVRIQSFISTILSVPTGWSAPQYK